MCAQEVRMIRVSDRARISEETGTFTGSESLVQQQFANECDVNTIVRRFGLNVGGPAVVPAGGLYGDFTGISDYESAVAAVERAEEGFLALPAAVRERFENSPARFLAWSGGRTLEELAELFPAPAKVQEPAAPVAPAPVAPAPVAPAS